MNRKPSRRHGRPDAGALGNESENAKRVEQGAAWLRERSPTQRLSNLLTIAGSDDVDLQVVQLHLGEPRCSQASLEAPLLQANVLLVALPGFLADAGIHVEGSIRPPSDVSGNRSTPPTTRMVEVSLDRFEAVPSDAMLFLTHADGERSVLTTSMGSFGESVEFTMFAADARPAELLERWQEHALRHAYLRGQRFYADGKLVRFEQRNRLADVRLSKQTRKAIEQTVLAFPRLAEAYARMGLPQKRGVLLEGPPGTGKTMLCRALCNEIDATFIWVTPRHAELDAEAFAALWTLARRLQPTVILLEDIDLYAESRDYSFRSGLLGELMNQMDGVEANDGVLVMATTNRVEVMENAIRNRPGRFDRILHVGELEDEDRSSLLCRYIAEANWVDGALEHALERTEGYTGAQLVDLVKTMVDLRLAAGETEIAPGLVQGFGVDVDDVCPVEDDGGASDDPDDADPAAHGPTCGLIVTPDLVDQALKQSARPTRRRRAGFGGDADCA